MDPVNQLQQLLESLRDGRADARRAAHLAPGWSPSRHPSFLDYLDACGALRAATPAAGADDHATATAVLPEPALGYASTEVAAAWPSGAESPTTLPYPPGGPLDGRESGPVPAGGPGRRYEPIRLHKSGGLGQVWLARDTVLGREVALKVVRPDRAARADLVARFALEARVTGRLEHPGIVPLYDLVEGRDAWGGGPCYVMRYVSGGTLAEAVEGYHARRAAGEATALGFRSLIDALVAVCRAVAFAHSRGVLHRDLKGQNVVLGEFGEVFLLDFGLTKLTGRPGDPAALTADGAGEGAAEESAPGTISGTPAYMAPEVAAGGESSKASDVYGLGAMLYAALTGKAPAEGATPQEVLHKVRSADPAAPRAVNPAASRALEAVCRKAMARRPADRYAGAADLATELVRWLADEPVTARREPWPDRAARWARRHRPAVAAALTTALTAVAALTLSTGLLYAEGRKTAAQKVSEEQRDRAEANLDVAHDLTIKIIAVTEKVLPPVSGSEGPRLELTQASVNAFRHFAEQRPGSPEVRRWTGQLSRVEANLLRLLGDTANAEKAYGVALKALRGDEANALRLAETLRDHAGLQARTGRVSAACSSLEEARTIVEGLRAADPARGSYQQVEATIHLDRSSNEISLGRYDLAAASADQSIALLRGRLVPENLRLDPYDTLMLTAALTCKAGAANGQGNLVAARAALAEAKATIKPYATAEKRSASLMLEDAKIIQVIAIYEEYRIALAGSKMMTEVAETNVGTVVSYLTEMTGRRPRVPDLRGRLGKVIILRGRIRQARSDPIRAAADFATARELLETLATEFPSIPEYRADLGWALLASALVNADHPMAARWREQGVAELRAAATSAPGEVDIQKSLAAAEQP